MKLIILDRDGVINYDSDKYVKNTEEWEPIPESLEAIANITQLGYKIVVCTNQSGIGRGLFTLEELNDIHEKMHKMVEQSGGEITAVFFCPHKTEDHCNCRKPMPGMIFDICDRFNVENIANVMLVGDSDRDLEAIHAAGGVPVLVKTGNGKKTLSKGKVPPGTLVFENLLEVSEYLMAKDNE
ncbi:MAG: D-glycero-beta-D-manno-heptose 1,7-bisphosphate 7-phosphatase [Proteobacteria bacterium]|jgi:D-glycero-D-manno-heptose 1,7-bisphosphate phosphatase|nr:D-glycero-beta-D-manno-heptose 1,7-bisphosphate 7-phosphatase [Pseudomonadota bacterium]